MTEYRPSGGISTHIELDRFDRRILSALAQNGRLTITDLAQDIGLSKSPTQARLRRLEQSGVFKGYRALLDPIQLGLDHVAGGAGSYTHLRAHETVLLFVCSVLPEQ